MRVKTSTLIQMESVECGAAAIGIILAYYGRYVPLEELRAQCGVSRDGVDAYHMLGAAKNYGLEVEAREVSLEELKHLTKPAILYWNNNHFIVLEGFEKDKVYINDPATGPRWITEEELTAHYSGVSFLLYPSSNFKKGGKESNIWTMIVSHLKPFRRDIITLVIIQACLIALTLVLPITIQLFLDKILNKSILDWKWIFLGILFISVVLTTIVTWVQLNFLNFLRARMDLLFSRRFLDHVLKLPMQFFTQRFGGEVIQRMMLNSTVANALSGDVLVASLSLILILFYALIIIQYDLWLTLIGISAALLNIAILAIISKIRTVPFAQFQQGQTKAIAVSLDTLEHIETVKANGNEGAFFAKIAGFYTENINAMQEIGRKDAWLFGASILSQQLTVAIVLSFGTWRVMHETMTIGMLVAIQLLLFNFLRPFYQLVNLGTKIQSLEVDLSRLDDIMRNKVDPLVLERKAKKEVDKLSGQIEFKDVTFGYTPFDEPIINNFNLSIFKGKWIGLKGKIASGKTTLAKLAIGLYKPWSGEILYDNENLFNYSRNSIAHSIGYVSQVYTIFEGTIRENLTLWNPHISDEQIEEALDKACIKNEILARPNGYQYKLRGNGSNFSEGEKQRLEIARVLINNPSILILDDATSTLDINLEKHIFKNLRNENVTAIIISNRSSVLDHCDQIVELKNG